MSTPHSNPEPGWYHAQGDEPGTVRLWNGHEWVGFPQRDPNGPADPVASVKPWEPILGQVKLKWFAIPAQVSFAAMALLYALGGIALLIVAATVDPSALDGSAELAEPTLAEPGTSAGTSAAAALIGFAFIAIFATVLVGPILFLIWFWRAYANMALWRENQYDTIWAFLAWIVPFINLRRPWRMVLELMEYSPDKEHEGDINPVWGLVWWIFFWAPQAIFNLLLVGLVNDPAAVAEDPESVGTSILFGLGLSWVLSAISLGCMIVVIQKVTAIQDIRLEPNELQIARYERDERERATMAVHAHEATPQLTTF